MKQIMSWLLAGIIAVTAIISMVPQGTAAESKVIFRRGTEWFSFSPGSGYTDSDLFENFKYVMPGDVLEQSITVYNRNRDIDAVRIYLRAEPHGKEKLPEIFDQWEGSLQDMEDFLSQLTLRVYQGSRCISTTTAKTGGPTENLYLGNVGPGESMRLRAELEIPVELDNRYAGRMGEVDWVFTAEVYKDPGSSDVPKTADGIGPAWGAMILSGGMLAGALLGKRKKQ